MKVSRRTPRIADQWGSKGAKQVTLCYCPGIARRRFDGLNECAAPGFTLRFRLFRSTYLQTRLCLIWAAARVPGQSACTTPRIKLLLRCGGSKRARLPFPYCRADLNADFSDNFPNGEYDAISFIEVVEHLENPRHSFDHRRSAQEWRAGFGFDT